MSLVKSAENQKKNYHIVIKSIRWNRHFFDLYHLIKYSSFQLSAGQIELLLGKLSVRNLTCLFPQKL